MAQRGARRIIDISLGVRAGGVVYPGNPPIETELVQALARGDGANVSRVSMGSHTATHVDAPRHFADDGDPVDALDLGVLVGPARLLAFGDDVAAVTAEHLRAHDLAGVERLLLRTRNSAWNTESGFRRDYAYLAPDGAEHLVALGVRLVGIDYLSIEQFRSGHHRTHHALLDRGVVIVEGLALAGVAPGDYDLICLPLKLEGLDGAPARAILMER